MSGLFLKVSFAWNKSLISGNFAVSLLECSPEKSPYPPDAWQCPEGCCHGLQSVLVSPPWSGELFLHSKRAELWQLCPSDSHRREADLQWGLHTFDPKQKKKIPNSPISSSYIYSAHFSSPKSKWWMKVSHQGTEWRWELGKGDNYYLAALLPPLLTIRKINYSKET